MTENNDELDYEGYTAGSELDYENETEEEIAKLIAISIIYLWTTCG